MKILASIHLYPPVHNCGAEYMMHQTLKFLQSEGHEVRVILHQANRHKIENLYSFEGVDVFPPTDYLTDKLFDWCDFVFTHLDYTQLSINLAQRYKKKCVHFVHNHSVYASITNAVDKQYVVYNSEVAKNIVKYPCESFILHPPVDYRFYDTGIDASMNEYITLINLDHNKGGNILSKIAERLPNKKFLGVVGSYSSDGNGQHTVQPANVKVIPTTTNIRAVYQMTRLLIMPSKFESWGRTATEAMCNGIPVISSGTEGLKENCGKAGIYVDRENIDEWVKEIEKLDDGRTYRKYQRLTRERAIELDPVNELTEFNNWLCTLK